MLGEQYLYSETQFIADVGGLLGLLLGASVLGLFESGLGLAKALALKRIH